MKWISTNDKLPKTGDRVLIQYVEFCCGFVVDEYVTIAEVKENGLFHIDDHQYDEFLVPFWMPLQQLKNWRSDS